MSKKYSFFVTALLLLNSCQLALERGLLPQTSSVKTENGSKPNSAATALPVTIPISTSPAPVLETPSSVPSPLDSSPKPMVSPTSVQMAVPSLPIPIVTQQPIPSPIVSSVGVQMEGFVTDDEEKPLAGAKILIFAEGRAALTPIETVTDVQGCYKTLVPFVYPFLVKVSKVGYTNKICRPSYLSTGNVGGVYGPARVDFTGKWPSDIDIGTLPFRYPVYGYTMPLSLKPEVNQVSPNSGTLAESQNPITLVFSHAMDKVSVEQSFAMRAQTDITLLTDKGRASPTFVGIGNAIEPKGTLVYNQEAFLFNWNSDSTQLTVSFKDGYAAPAHPTLPNSYQITFLSAIKNQAGMIRENEFFYYNNAARNSNYSLYKIKPDILPPGILTAIIQTDAIALKFNESMIYRTHSLSVAGGMADRNSITDAYLQAPAEYPGNKGISTGTAAAGNYTVTITSNGATTTKTWKEWGGTAVFDSQDPTQVNLTLPVTAQDITAFIRNYQTVPTQPLTTTITSDNEDNSTFQWGWQLVKSDGSLMAQFLTPDLETSQQNTNTPFSATKLAETLAAQLNLPTYTTELVPPTSPNPWKVEPSTDGKFVSFTFTDTTRNYAGWRWSGGIYTLHENDKWPTALTGFNTWAAGTSLKPFQSGDTLTVEVAATVVDPAGNTMNPDKKKAMVTIP